MKGRIPALTGIRGVAASWVVLLHYHHLLVQLDVWPAWIPTGVAMAGYLAVDLFFILSGFVLALSYVDRLRHAPTLAGLSRFVLNRIFRILPLNTICLFAMLGLVLLFGKESWTTFPLDLPSFVAALLLVQAWGVGSATTWNLPAWSLSAEWLAYAVFPVLVVITAWVTSRRLALAGWMLCLLLLAGLMIQYGGATLDHTWLLGLPRCLLQFTAGMMLWRAMSVSPFPTRAADLLMLAGFSLVVFVICFPRFQLLAPPAFSAMVVACAARGKVTERLLGNRVVELLGEISFSLYLTHFILLGFFVYLARATSIAEAGAPARVSFVLAAAATVYLLSWAAWRWVELPGQRMGRQLASPRPT